MTERFKSLILAIHDFQGSTYDLTLQGGVNALCNLINGLNNKSNRLEKENEQLKEALKNSYINEICENCKHGHYFLTDNFVGGFEGDFECLKEHFGNDHWECDGLTECDDFELEIER